jgi:hypothetical protein
MESLGWGEAATAVCLAKQGQQRWTAAAPALPATYHLPQLWYLPIVAAAACVVQARHGHWLLLQVILVLMAAADLRCCPTPAGWHS